MKLGSTEYSAIASVAPFRLEYLSSKPDWISKCVFWYTSFNMFNLCHNVLNSKEEILPILTSNYYSILYYNLDVLYIPNLKPPLTQLLLSASANAIKLAQRWPNFYESFIDVHKSCKRATPDQMITFKHATLLHKLYNVNLPQADWVVGWI